MYCIAAGKPASATRRFLPSYGKKELYGARYQTAVLTSLSDTALSARSSPTSITLSHSAPRRRRVEK
jgi:hypothetical protein